MSWHDSNPGTKADFMEASQTSAENNVLPDGTVFHSWEQPRHHSHTYHVSSVIPRQVMIIPEVRRFPGEPSTGPQPYSNRESE